MIRRATTRARWRQFTGWVAAYALALHMLLAAAVFPRDLVRGGVDASSFTLCLTHAGGTAPTSDGIPAGAADCDLHCTLARSIVSALLLAPNTASVGIAFDTISITWSVADNPIPDLVQFICER